MGLPIQLRRQIVHQKLAVGVALQKIQQPLPPRGFIGTGHITPSFPQAFFQYDIV
jgi:hypothetical protein